MAVELIEDFVTLSDVSTTTVDVTVSVAVIGKVVDVNGKDVVVSLEPTDEEFVSFVS